MSLVVGGVVPPENVVGRVREEQEILASLPDGGAALVGDRRHGKTSLARLVAHSAARLGWTVVTVSAERQSYEEFVTALASELGRLDNTLRQEVDRWRIAFGTGPVRFERAHSEAALDDLLRRAVAGFRRRLPAFVAALPSGQRRAPHHRAVGPIRDDHATYLAECLLLGTSAATTDRYLVAQAISAAAEQVPYYTQHLVAAIAKTGSPSAPIGPDRVAALLDAAIHDPYDPWDLRHYRDRLHNYYGADSVVSAEVLDIYAHSAEPLPAHTVLQRLIAQGSAITDHARLVSLMERLEQDHYLRRVGDDDCFASGLIQRAWRAMRR